MTDLVLMKTNASSYKRYTVAVHRTRMVHYVIGLFLDKAKSLDRILFSVYSVQGFVPLIINNGTT